MSQHSVQADKLEQSAPDPEQDAANDYSEEDEVERSYKENCSGNAQDAVKTLLDRMDFLERKNDLLYNVPRGGATHCSRYTCMR